MACLGFSCSGFVDSEMLHMLLSCLWHPFLLRCVDLIWLCLFFEWSGFRQCAGSALSGISICSGITPVSHSFSTSPRQCDSQSSLNCSNLGGYKLDSSLQLCNDWCILQIWKLHQPFNVSGIIQQSSRTLFFPFSFRPWSSNLRFARVHLMQSATFLLALKSVILCSNMYNVFFSSSLASL